MTTRTFVGRHRVAPARKRLLAVLFAGVLAAVGLASAGPALAGAPTTTFTGQGFLVEDGTPNLKTERCGLSGQDDADDGGTGQFANWNGPGQPYTAGQSYLLWVLTLNADPAAGVQLHLPDGEVDMIKVGGTWKYASEYYAYNDLINQPAHATYSVSGVKGKVNLVVSHGCQPFADEGAWCSPGYWRNASDASWALAGAGKNDKFNDTVVPGFYDTASAADPTLIQVLTTPGANTFGAASGPYGLNAFNATGAYLTDQIPGYSFDPAKIGAENACPIDNHGNFK